MSTDHENARLRAELEQMTKLHALAERAMRSAHQASRDLDALAMAHFDAKEPLEAIVDAARAFVDAQAPCAGGDIAGDKLYELEQALEAGSR